MTAAGITVIVALVDCRQSLGTGIERVKALFSPSANRVLREDVAEAIREVIIGGPLKPGDRIIESAIAEQMGISRAPVREAIRHRPEGISSRARGLAGGHT